MADFKVTATIALDYYDGVLSFVGKIKDHPDHKPYEKVFGFMKDDFAEDQERTYYLWKHSYAFDDGGNSSSKMEMIGIVTINDIDFSSTN